MRNLKRWQKVVLVAVIFFATLTTVAILTILALLPDPAAIGARFQSPRSKTPSPVTTATGSSASTSTAPSVSTSTTADTVATLSKEERERLLDEKAFERFIRDDRITANVCDNLASKTAPFENIKELRQQVESAMLGEKPPSATAEAFMIPLEHFLKIDAVRSIISAAQEAGQRGETSFFEKAQFYAMSVRLAASIANSREEFDALSGHTYRLYTIGRAAALKPEILQDPETDDLCRGIQRSAIDGLKRDEAFDRKRLLRLLLRHDIDPKAIGYDPRISTRIYVFTGSYGLRIRVPWAEKVLKYGPYR